MFLMFFTSLVLVGRVEFPASTYFVSCCRFQTRSNANFKSAKLLQMEPPGRWFQSACQARKRREAEAQPESEEIPYATLTREAGSHLSHFRPRKLKQRRKNDERRKLQRHRQRKSENVWFGFTKKPALEVCLLWFILATALENRFIHLHARVSTVF